MKILLATGLFPPDIGGPATYSKLLCDELPKEGIDVDVLSFGSVRRLPKVIRHVSYALKLLWHARTADAIFAQDTVSVGFPALIASYILGKTFMVRIPGDYAWEQAMQRFGVTDSVDDFQSKRYGLRIELLRWVQRLVVEQADQAIAPSRYFAKLANGWLKNGDKVIAVYNGIDTSDIVKLGTSGAFEPKTIISAGRLVPWKGFEMLIHAMKRLPGWKLSIAGDGPKMQELQDIIAREGLSGRVTMLGRVKSEDLLVMISRSEIFALNTGFESFSFQIVYAMAAGAPIITTSIGDIPEIIDDGQSGILIAPDDEAGFVAAVGRISSDPGLRRRLVDEGRKKAAMFSIEKTAGVVAKIVTDLRTDPSPSKKRRTLAAKLVRYLFSGGTAAVTDLVLLYVFTDICHIWYLVSSVLAFLVAFGVSFVLQKFFTFQDHGTEGMHRQAMIYFAVTSTNLVLNTGLIYLFVQYTGMNYIIAQIVTSILIAIESYLVYQAFIFKKS